MTPEPPAHTVFGVQIHAVTMPQVIDQVYDWFDSERPPQQSSPGCRYIVTPNVNHVVALDSNEALRQAYRSASLVIADGWPVIAAARLLGSPLPERVAGSDLVPRVFEESALRDRSVSVFLLGGMPGIGERAAERIAEKWPNTRIAGVYSPPFGFELDPAELQEIRDRINTAEPDFLVVGLGAPKQEVWLSENYHLIKARVAVAAGATIDFLAGEQTRAPKIVRWLGFEWLFRIGTDPGRLAKRYLRDGIAFPRLIVREFFAARPSE